MSGDLYQFLLSLSIVFPFTICVLRVKQIPISYYPLCILITIGLINEVINYFFFRSGNAIPMNTFNLIEYILYCWQFRNWKHILKRISFYIVTGAMLIYWITDELILEKIATYTSGFLIIYPFVLVLLAVNELNYLVANDHGNILKNAIFIFCMAMIVFYCYKILSEIFYRYAADASLQEKIFGIQMYVNVLFNFLLTLVVLCIPKKRTITLP